MTATKLAYGSAAIAANGSGRKRREHQYIQQVLDAAFVRVWNGWTGWKITSIQIHDRQRVSACAVGSRSPTGWYQ
jgi:hypothetical protein